MILVETPTRADRIWTLIIVSFIVLALYLGLYFAFRRAQWLRDTGYFGDPRSSWIEANERMPWLEWPFIPVMRIEESLRGYSGEPLDLK